MSGRGEYHAGSLEADIVRAALYVPLMQRERPFSFQLIELTELDVSDVANLYARCSDYFLLQDGELATAADARDLFFGVPPEKGMQDQVVFGCKGDEGLCAVAAILRDYPLSGTWYLGFMIVDAQRRGRGLGRMIYSAVEHWAVARGAVEIRLAVLEQNEPGARFWRSLGFGEVRRVGPDVFKMRTHNRIELSRVINGGLGQRSAE